MGTTRTARALALVALSLLAACAPRATGQDSAPVSAVEADIAAARPAGGPASTPPQAFAESSLTSAPASRNVPAFEAPTLDRAGPVESAVSGDPGIGRSFALDNCRPCHVVSPDQRSPVRFANAPDFRSVANQPKTTRFSLNIWLTNPHPTMPTLRLTPDEASNVIAYIMSLRGSR
ncbi:MAG TPA: hypothetical protein VET85_03105 [Stellaceae bacterium]|nr:hypothetical protein [Stellaceae bacterium]